MPHPIITRLWRPASLCVLQSCTSRCVRRAFLCGNDPYTGISYEHRRKTIEDRILLLGTIFCIDVCAYAVMNNHHHLVLHINKAKSMKLSDIEVCTRWHKLFKGTVLTQKFESKFNTFVGATDKTQKAKTALGYKRVRGLQQNRLLFE